MILTKSAVSSILVLLGACDRATTTTRPTAGDATSPSASVAAVPVVRGSTKDDSPPARSPAVSTSAGKPSAGAAKTVYVCPMHPEVVSETPGLCPKCNMKLDPKTQATEVRQAAERVETNWP